MKSYRNFERGNLSLVCFVHIYFLFTRPFCLRLPKKSSEKCLEVHLWLLLPVGERRKEEVKDGSCLELIFITKGGVSDDLELKPPGKEKFPLHPQHRNCTDWKPQSLTAPACLELAQKGNLLTSEAICGTMERCHLPTAIPIVYLSCHTQAPHSQVEIFIALRITFITLVD
jgi:hypothetical protein